MNRRIVTLNGTVNSILGRFGLEMRRKGTPDDSEGFSAYLQAAQSMKMDVNDWIEQVLGWGNPLTALDQIVFPILRADMVVCELGAGTGRYSRHIASRLTAGELHLVDHSPWLNAFLRHYFDSKPNVHVHLNDGATLPLENSQTDLVFSSSTFIEFKLCQFYAYAEEFSRILKPAGQCIFDYFDITTKEGWAHLHAQSRMIPGCFAYHTPDVVDRVFSTFGLEATNRYQIGKSTYVVMRKSQLMGGRP